MNISSNIIILILAAGSSSRMGRSKQLLEIQGKTLLQRTIQAAKASGADKVIVVLGSNEKDHRKALGNEQIDIVYNPDWQKGIGSSIKAGLRHISTSEASSIGIIITVCDQPLLTSSHFKKLITAFNETKIQIIASRYDQTLGVPVFFANSFFEQLLHIEDHSGAKQIISSYQQEVLSIDFPEGAIDLDTPDDYQKFMNKSKS